MIWLMLGVLSMAAVSNCEEGDMLVSSLSDMVRSGATLVSRFLNLKPFHLHFPAFQKLKQGQTLHKEKVENGGVDGKELILGIFRLLGIDSRKMNDFAFEGFLSLLHLMSEILLKDGEKSRTSRKVSGEFPSFRFILTQPQVVDLLKDMQNPNLVDLILKESQEKLKDFPEEDVECIHLLICKTKPFVGGMQRSLRFFMNRENITGEEDTCRGKAEENECKGEEEAFWEKATLEGRMYFFLPTLEEVVEEGDKCDVLFPNCDY